MVAGLNPASYTLCFVLLFVILDWVQLAMRRPGRTGTTDLELSALGIAAALAVPLSPLAWELAATVINHLFASVDPAATEYADATLPAIATVGALGILGAYSVIDYLVRAPRNNAPFAGHGCAFAFIAYITNLIAPVVYLVFLSRRSPYVRVALAGVVATAGLLMLDSAQPGLSDAVLVEVLRVLDAAGFVVFALGDTVTSAFAVSWHPAVTWALWGALFGSIPGILDGTVIFALRRHRRFIAWTPTLLLVCTAAITVTLHALGD